MNFFRDFVRIAIDITKEIINDIIGKEEDE